MAQIVSFAKTTFVLLLIMLLSLSITAQFFTKEYFAEPDSYYHARMVGYIIEEGQVPQKDPQAYYYLGGSTVERYTLLWPVTAFVYESFFGKEIQQYRIIYAAQLITIILGALLIVLSYFAGKELFGKSAGYLTAFLVAILPAITFKMQTSIFEDDLMGLIPLVLGIILFSKAFKENNFEKRLLLIISSGVSFGLIAWIWEGYAILVPVFLIAFPLMIFLKTLNESTIKNSVEFCLELILFSVSFLGVVLFSGADFFGLLMTNIRNLGIQNFALPQTQVFGIGLIIFLFALIFIAPLVFGKIFLHANRKQKALFSLAPFYLLLFALFVFLFFVPSLRSPENPMSFILEENNGFFYLKETLGLFVGFALFFLFIAPLKFLEKKKLNENVSFALLFSFLVISLFLGFYFIKYVFVFALALALVSGFLLEKILAMKKERRFIGLKKNYWLGCFIVLFLCGFVFLGISPSKISNAETRLEVVDAFNWARENTPNDSSILVWWDYGHIASFFSERKVTNDNKNWKGYLGEPNKKVAEFFSTQNVGQSFLIAQDYFKSDYVFIDPEMFFSLKEMKSIILGKVDNSKDYSLGNDIFNCLSKETCALVEEGMGEKPLDKWIDSNAVVIYKTEKLMVYLNQETNATALAKIYFHSPESEKYFEEVYSSGIVKIFKVKK